MQRHDHYIREFGETGYRYTSDMQRIENGKWVRYEEAAKLIADRDAEIERLRADLVWAVRTCCEQFDDNLIVWQTGSEELGEIVFDGTDADILRAVREARGSL